MLPHPSSPIPLTTPSPAGTRHDNASIPRLRRRPSSSARALCGRDRASLHLRGRLRPHGPCRRRRAHALFGVSPREVPVRILEGRRARGLLRTHGHRRAHPHRLGHLLRHDEGLGRRRRPGVSRRASRPHGPRLHRLRASGLLPDGGRHGFLHRHASCGHADLLSRGRCARGRPGHARGRGALGRHLRRQPRARLGRHRHFVRHPALQKRDAGRHRGRRAHAPSLRDDRARPHASLLRLLGRIPPRDRSRACGRSKGASHARAGGDPHCGRRSRPATC